MKSALTCICFSKSSKSRWRGQKSNPAYFSELAPEGHMFVDFPVKFRNQLLGGEEVLDFLLSQWECLLRALPSPGAGSADKPARVFAYLWFCAWEREPQPPGPATLGAERRLGLSELCKCKTPGCLLQFKYLMPVDFSLCCCCLLLGSPFAWKLGLCVEVLREGVC